MTDDPLDELPEGWTIWNVESGGRVILAYRPDIFEGEQFPAACLPTLYVSQSAPDQPRRRGANPQGQWYVTLYLEPEVRVRDYEHTVSDRTRALETAVEVAEAFANGSIPIRSAYQVPREEYIAELERLTGADNSSM